VQATPPQLIGVDARADDHGLMAQDFLMLRKDRSEKSEQQQNDGIEKKLSPIVNKFHSTCC
jgi:hypothetical protein